MQVEAVVFDVGRVLYQWHLRHLFEKIVDDRARLETLLGEARAPRRAPCGVQPRREDRAAYGP